MSEAKYMQDIIDTPDVNGLFQRSQNLQRFGDDADIIVDTRDKLNEIRKDLVSQDDLVEKEKALLKGIKDDKKWTNRHYDNKIFKHQPKGALSHLFSFFKIKKFFQLKYGKTKIVRNFFNILFDRPIFHPDMATYMLVKNMIANQHKLRQYARKIYNKGWLNDSGEEILSPYEFNLIGEFERLIYDEGIYNFIIYHKQPNIALKKINSFLGYFLSIHRDSEVRKMLFEALEKSLTKIVFTDPKDKALSKKIFSDIKDFLNGNLIEDFIIPLFECAYLREFNRKMLYESINLFEISKFEYMAPSNLKILMFNKKSELNTTINDKLIKIEKEIEFIQYLVELKEKKITLLNGRTLSLLDNYLLIHNNNDNEDFKVRKNNFAAYITDMSTFFKNVFEGILLNGVNIRLRDGVESVMIFGKEVFSKEIANITSSVRICSNYIPSGIDDKILNKRNLNKSETILINSLNILSDSFYSIGIKLHTLMENHEKVKSSAPFKKQLLLDDLESSSIPYYKERIVNLHASITNKYSLGNKHLLEGLKEVCDFALTFALLFEYAYRDYKDSIRNESLTSRLRNIHALNEKLEQLQMGENVEL